MTVRPNPDAAHNILCESIGEVPTSKLKPKCSFAQFKPLNHSLNVQCRNGGRANRTGIAYSQMSANYHL